MGSHAGNPASGAKTVPFAMPQDVGLAAKTAVLDRPWMAIDTAAGPHQGNIYVTSMNAKQALGNPPYNPYVARSTDGGATFGAPRFLDTLGYLAGSVATQPMPSPAAAAAAAAAGSGGAASVDGYNGNYVKPALLAGTLDNVAASPRIMASTAI